MVDERGIFLRERLEGIQAKTNNRAVVKPQGNMTLCRRCSCDHLFINKPLSYPNGLAVNLARFQVKSGATEHIPKPCFRRVGVGAGAHESTVPTEEVHASLGMVFPRQHSQCEVGVVLDACHVARLSITAPNIGTRTE